MQRFALLDPAAGVTLAATDAGFTGTVRIIEVLPVGATPAEFRHEGVARLMAPCPDTAVEEGWVYAVDAQGAAAYSVPPVPPPTVAQLLAYASKAQNQLLASVWAFNVAAAGAPAHKVTTKLDLQGHMMLLKADLWSQTNAQRADAAWPYTNDDMGATTLGPAEAASLAAQGLAVEPHSYGVLNALTAGITASPPTITAYSQIDAAFAALGPST